MSKKPIILKKWKEIEPQHFREQRQRAKISVIEGVKAAQPQLLPTRLDLWKNPAKLLQLEGTNKMSWRNWNQRWEGTPRPLNPGSHHKARKENGKPKMNPNLKRKGPKKEGRKNNSRVGSWHAQTNFCCCL
jgi:hypothetical protein